MNILMSSYYFFPSVGGLEEVSRVLAREFARAGHVVKLVTQTPSIEVDDFPFEVVRRPTPLQLLGLMRWCDVYFQNNISLLLAWPLVPIRRPWVVAHHIWLSHNWKGRLKRWLLLRSAVGISISQAIASEFPPSTVIPDPYDDQVFHEIPDGPRNRDLVFAGRLVSDKGAYLVLEALTDLRSQGRRLTLTIVGYGPEEAALRRLAQRLGLDDQVYFAGVQRGEDLAMLLNAHRIMIVPSIWLEPFGIVALEGIACGCIVVGSEGGGLKDAIGLCGVTFPNGDVEALTRCLVNLYDHPEHWAAFRAAAAEHLARHTPAAVASAYLRVLEEVKR